MAVAGGRRREIRTTLAVRALCAVPEPHRRPLAYDVAAAGFQRAPAAGVVMFLTAASLEGSPGGV